MTAIDIFAIKQQVVAILKNDTSNIYSATPSDKSLFRKIEAGAPSPKAVQEPPLPRCWVTSDTVVANVKKLGDVVSNAHTGEEYDVRLRIVFVVEAKDGSATEEKIDDFTQAIVQKLDDNYDLRTPGGIESTRVAEASEVLQIMDLPEVFKGDRVRGRVIRFKVIVRA